MRRLITTAVAALDARLDAIAAGSTGTYSGNTLARNGSGDTWDGLTAV